MEQRIVSEILKKNEPFLSRHLVLSRTVLDKLHQHGLLADYMRRKILLHPADRQVELLIRTMENRGLASLRKLLEVLKDTGHGYLVDVILDTDAIPVTDIRPDTSKPARSGREHYDAVRPTRSVHAQRGPGPLASLNTILRMRKEQEQTTTRGALLPRTLLSDSVVHGYSGGSPGRAVLPGDYGVGPSYHQQPSAAHVSSKDVVPSTLYNLGKMFNHQQKENEQALVVLRQEEMAIKQLMEQNARDQQKVRRKQFSMSDLSKRLADINARANEIYEPAPDPNMTRYRLAQLSQIPWSVDQ
ncbi:hypothetical protein ACOMHN_046612 [Nucella lapillus]